MKATKGISKNAKQAELFAVTLGSSQVTAAETSKQAGMRATKRISHLDHG